MSGPARRILAWMAAAWLICGCGDAGAGPADDENPGEQNVPESAPDDETLALFAEDLAAGGISPEDIADADAAPAPPDGHSGEVFGTESRFASIGGATTRRLRGSLEAGGILCRYRGASSDDSDRAVLALERRGGMIALGAGGMGMEHGFGLIAAAPGRWRSLAAASGLGAGRQGWTPYASGRDRRALVGAAVGLSGRGWDLQTVVGEGDDPDGDPEREDARLVRLSRRGRISVAMLLGSTASGSGGSFHVEARSEGIDCAAECARWRPRGAETAGGAWAAHAGRRRGRLLVEALAAAADPGFAPPLGRRPAVLLDEAGRGWGLRAAAGLGRGNRISALAADAWLRESAAAGCEVSRRQRLEIAAAGAPVADLRFSGRFRWDTERTTARLPEAPWLPPGIVVLRRETRFSLKAEWRPEGGAARLTVSSLGRRDERREGDGLPAFGLRRTMAAIRAECGLGAGLILRGAMAWAWGDEVDLVTAAAPAPGILRPRHWGRWSAETSLGMDWRRGGRRLSVAFCRRRPTRAAGSTSLYEFHLRLDLRGKLPL